MARPESGSPSEDGLSCSFVALRLPCRRPMSRADLRKEGRLLHEGGEAFCSRRVAEEPVQRFAWPGELRDLQAGLPPSPGVRAEEEVRWGLRAAAAALRCGVVVVEPCVVLVEVPVSRPGCDEEAERPPGEGMLPFAWSSVVEMRSCRPRSSRDLTCRHSYHNKTHRT